MAVDETTSNGKASAVPFTFPKERGGESACVARCGSRRVYFRQMVRFLGLTVKIFELNFRKFPIPFSEIIILFFGKK